MCTANKNNQQMHYRYKQPTNISSHSQWTWLPLLPIYKYNTSWKSYHGPCYCTFKVTTVTTILVKTYPNTPDQQKLPTRGNQQKWHDKPDYWKWASKLADSGTGWVYFIMNKSQRAWCLATVAVTTMDTEFHRQMSTKQMRTYGDSGTNMFSLNCNSQYNKAQVPVCCCLLLLFYSG